MTLGAMAGDRRKSTAAASMRAASKLFANISKSLWLHPLSETA
jgi:hypothetical protein